jgi:hypothetical protein
MRLTHGAVTRYAPDSHTRSDNHSYRYSDRHTPTISIATYLDS